MTYSFRLCLPKDPRNEVPMIEPANYDPARFELTRRHLRAGGDANQVGSISILCQWAGSTVKLLPALKKEKP